MPPDIFGVPWRQVNREHVAALLASSRDEALTWEAKADGKEVLGRHELTKAACAFANSEDGGYVLIGVAKGQGRHEIVGLQHAPWGDSDPQKWIDDTISSWLNPVPRCDVRVLEGGPFLAVVSVDPVAEPPCLTGSGTAYVRTSTSSRPISEPSDLARLYGRGRAARQRAETSVREGVSLAHALAPGDLPFAWVGLAPTGLDPNFERALFSQEFMIWARERLVSVIPSQRFASTIFDGQGSRAVWVADGSKESGSWLVAQRTGAIFAGISLGPPGSEQLLELEFDRIDESWQMAVETAAALRGVGQVFTVVGAFTRNSGPVTVDCWTASLGPMQQEVREAVRQDLKRATGRTAYDPLPMGWHFPM